MGGEEALGPVGLLVQWKDSPFGWARPKFDSWVGLLLFAPERDGTTAIRSPHTPPITIAISIPISLSITSHIHTPSNGGELQTGGVAVEIAIDNRRSAGSGKREARSDASMAAAVHQPGDLCC